jgi:hypothetical protein
MFSVWEIGTVVRVVHRPQPQGCNQVDSMPSSVFCLLDTLKKDVTGKQRARHRREASCHLMAADRFLVCRDKSLGATVRQMRVNNDHVQVWSVHRLPPVLHVQLAFRITFGIGMLHSLFVENPLCLACAILFCAILFCAILFKPSRVITHRCKAPKWIRLATTSSS